MQCKQKTAHHADDISIWAFNLENLSIDYGVILLEIWFDREETRSNKLIWSFNFPDYEVKHKKIIYGQGTWKMIPDSKRRKIKAEVERVLKKIKGQSWLKNG